MPAKDRSNATVVKVAIPDDLLPSVNAAAEAKSQFRSHWIIDAIHSRLASGDAALDRSKFPATVTSILKATNGKLSRTECEHLVSLVIIGMAK